MAANTPHLFVRLTPANKAYRWNRPNMRCQHCHVDQDHVEYDHCVVLADRLKGEKVHGTAAP